MDALLKQRSVGVADLFVDAEKLDDLVGRDHRTVAMRLGLGESLAQMEQQNGVEEGQMGAAQEPGHFQVTRLGLAGKGHLQVAVNHQLQKQLRQTASDRRFITNQDRPELGVTLTIHGRAGEELYQYTTGIQ